MADAPDLCLSALRLSRYAVEDSSDTDLDLDNDLDNDLSIADSVTDATGCYTVAHK